MADAFITLLIFVIGYVCGMGVKPNITINHVHKEDKPELDEGYNKSYGDPNARLYLDKQFGSDE